MAPLDPHNERLLSINWDYFLCRVTSHGQMLQSGQMKSWVSQLMMPRTMSKVPPYLCSWLSGESFSSHREVVQGLENSARTDGNGILIIWNLNSYSMKICWLLIWSVTATVNRNTLIFQWHEKDLTVASHLINFLKLWLIMQRMEDELQDMFPWFAIMYGGDFPIC